MSTLTFTDDNPRNLIVSGIVPADSKPVVAIVPVERPAELARVMSIEALERAEDGLAERVLARFRADSTLANAPEHGDGTALGPGAATTRAATVDTDEKRTGWRGRCHSATRLMSAPHCTSLRPSAS